MLTNSVSVDIGTGIEAFWINGKLRVGGYFNNQRIKFPIKSSSAYGFFYVDKGRNDIYGMHDFNREKDGAFTNNTPHLPLTQMTYDIYTVSGQGLSGMFRLHRDFATVYDPYTFSNSTGNSFGGDAGGGNLFKGGINYRNTSNYSQKVRWTSNSNQTRNNLSFNGREDGLDPILYEPFYMKSAGEFTTIDDNYFNKIQGFNPVRIEITKDGEALQNYKKLTNLSSMTESSTPVVSNIRAKRDRRNRGNEKSFF